MKQNILKTFRRLCVPALVLGTFFASCTDELSSEVVQGGGGTAGESEVTLRLQVPAAGGGSQTRAVDDDTENTVNDLYILAFKAGKDGDTFDYYVTASKTAAATVWTANLRVRQEQQTFVMVANAQGTPGKVNEQIAALAANSVGHKKDEVLAKLTDALTAVEQTAGFNAAATTDHHPFTMYGQTAATVIAADTDLTVRMHRIVARVQVSFTGDAAGTKFTPQEVSLYNYNDRARVIPNNLTETVEDVYEIAPTIPAGAVRLPAKVDGKQQVPTYTVDASQKIEHQIYLFETGQPQTGTAAERHVQRPCLIVKGVYENDAKPCYYRIDFFGQKIAGNDVKEYMDIVRNHTYNVTVQNVLAPGHDTPEEALTSQAADITATVVKWNDAEIGDIDFDGEHMLGIATMKYELGRKGSNGGNLLQQVKASKGLKWTVKLHAVDANGKVDTNTEPDWINFLDKNNIKLKELSGTGTNELEDLKFEVTRFGAYTDERRAVMRFTARNLMVEALVVQDQSDPVYINVKIGDRIITETEFDELGGECAEMTIEFGPEGTELDWKAYSSNGIALKDAIVNGTGQGKLEGKIQSNNDQNGQSIAWKANVGAFATTADYATNVGVLTLIAKGKKGVVSKTIKLVQHKYGVSLNTGMIALTGDPEVVKVTGNMNWVVEPVRTHDQDGDSGYDSAVDKGYIREYNRNETGFPSSEYYNYGLNCVTFETALIKEKDAKPIDIKLRFTDKARNKSVIKTLTVQPGFIYNGAVYALWGPVKLTMDQYNAIRYKPADCPEGYTRINAGQAQALVNAGYATKLGHNRTKIQRGWEFNGCGYTNYILTGTPESAPLKSLYDRSSTTYSQAFVRRIMRYENIATDANTTYEDATLIKRFDNVFIMGYDRKGSMIGIYVGTFVPEYLYEDPERTDLVLQNHTGIRITWKIGGYWNQITGWSGNHYPMNQPSTTTDWNKEAQASWTFTWDASHIDDPNKPSWGIGWIPGSTMFGSGVRWSNASVNRNAYVQSDSGYKRDDLASVVDPKLETYYIKKVKDLN